MNFVLCTAHAKEKKKGGHTNPDVRTIIIIIIIIQWNPSITATIGEQHYGCYIGVAVVEGFCVLNVQMSILNTYGA